MSKGIGKRGPKLRRARAAEAAAEAAVQQYLEERASAYPGKDRSIIIQLEREHLEYLSKQRHIPIRELVSRFKKREPQVPSQSVTSKDKVLSQGALFDAEPALPSKSEETDVINISPIDFPSQKSSQKPTPSLPPQLGERLLLLILTKEDRANIPGDLEEEFAQIAAKHGARFAKVWYYKQVATSTWPMIRKVAKCGVLTIIGEWIRRIM